jgi:hypothetical protein
MIDLRLGDYRDVLADVECDALIADPPYGERTHAGHDAGVEHTEIGTPRWDTARRRRLSYSFWTPDDVNECVDFWHPRTRGWFCAFSCSDLFPHWRAAFERVGRVSFAPVACVIRAMSVRLSGDGPSNWVIYLNVARPRGLKDGARNGAYVVNRDPGHIGGKPLDLMLGIVRDYSREGDLVCDPCAGGGTTLRAAEMLGRRAIGAEVDSDTYAIAMGAGKGKTPEGQLGLWRES